MSNEMQKAPEETRPLYAGEAMWHTNKGVYLGCMVETPDAKARFPLEKFQDAPPVGAESPIKSRWITNGGRVEFVGDRHIFTVGPNGSGKTRKLLMPNLFKLKDWSIVVVDPKGELCAHTALHRSRGENHRVIVFDPYGVIPTNYPLLYAKHPDLFKSHSFNALAAIKEGDSFTDDAAEVAAALVKNDDARDPYWTMAAQSLIEGLIMARKVDKDGARANLNDVRAILGLSPQALANFCAARIEELGERCPEMAANLSEFTKYLGEDRELSGIRRTAKTHTKWMGSRAMQRCLEGGTFDAATMKETPTTVYLVLPPKQLAKKAVWLRLMITSLLMPLLDSVEIKAGQVPVLFMLDEFAQLGHMEIIQNNYAMLRGFGVKLWTVWQGVGQAEFLYKEWWENFLGQAGAVQSFGLPTDLKSREYFSRFEGDRLMERQTHSRTQSDTVTTGENTGTSAGAGGHTFKIFERNSNQSESSGRSTGRSSSTTENWGQQFSQERSLKPHELAALDRDETILFDRRGKLHFSVVPQPEIFEGKFGETLREARALIEGREGEGRDVEAA